jgi:hypothetical protein
MYFHLKQIWYCAQRYTALVIPGSVRHQFGMLFAK